MKTKRLKTNKLLGLSVLLVLFALSTLWAEEPQIIFKADPAAVPSGKPVRLSWRVTGVEDEASVYLMGVGMVNTEGEILTDPILTGAAYTLLVESPAGLRSAVVTVKVTGRILISESTRGKAFPDDADFRHERTYEIPSSSLIQLMDCMHMVLKDSLEFDVDERYDSEKGKMIFITRPKRKTGETVPGASRVMARQLAYRVELSRSRSNEANTLCRIKTFIEYQRRGEPRRWRPETSPVIHRRNASELHRRMKSESMCGGVL